MDADKRKYLAILARTPGSGNVVIADAELLALVADSERAERYRKAIEFHLNECDCGNRKCKYCDKLFVIALQEPTDAK